MKKSEWTFLGVIGFLIIDLIGESIKDILKAGFPGLFPPLVRLFHWLYSGIFVDWAPIHAAEPIIEFAYIVVCFSGLFLVVVGVLWSAQALPRWVQWFNSLRAKWQDRRDSTQNSSGVTEDPNLIIEEAPADPPNPPELQISLTEYISAFSQLATVLDKIDEPDVDETQASRIAEDFLTRVLDSVAACFEAGPNEYRGLYMVPTVPEQKSESETNWRYVHFGRKGQLTNDDYEWIRALMTGFIGQTNIGSDSELVALFDNDIYDGKAIALMRNEGNFKLALAVVLTRSDGVTGESKLKFRQLASQFRLIGHLPQITRFMLD